jgi:Fe2+ or Zn2+ uptake regulation protein
MKEDIIELLKENKVKITNERKEIISILENAEFPLRPADIFLRLTPILPKANLTTVYRNLEMLVGLNLVKRLGFDKSSFLYELVTDRPHHHHAVCRKCGKVQDLVNISEKFLEEVSLSAKFQIEDHNLDFFGLCEDCKNK